MKNILAETAANQGRTSFRIAETEKYAHVTYFFNGGNEVEYTGEERILIPSPKVATYDLKPDMSGGLSKNVFHLVGLLSDGGVHSLQDHLYGLLDMAVRRGVKDVRIHAFTDGRDTSPTAGMRYLAELQDAINERGVGRIATVTGRYFAMDRDKRWDRVRRAYDALTLGAGHHTTDFRAVVRESYDRGVTDEFIEPIVVVDDGDDPVGTIKNGDAIFFYNFRADRARQLTSALIDPDFEGFDREVLPDGNFIAMTKYDRRFDVPIAFPPVKMKNILAETAANQGRTSFRIAETEKYAHVTYFFNGGNEVEYTGEERILIPSPKVATYDLKPDMSAFELADTLIQKLRNKHHDYLICNFANPDMVGHTGVLDAAIAAVETVDTCVGRVLEALDPDKDVAIVTADHGNAEVMVDPKTGGPHTAHTTNPVPCILVDNHYRGKLISGGSLKEIAPTICNYIGITPPKEMTGRDLRADV